MKKLVALLLAMAICLSLCACGGKSNEIELTSENYATYLNISYRYSDDGDTKILRSGDEIIICNTLESCKMTIAGASPNYDYNNVVITIKVTATYDTYKSFDNKTAGVTYTEEVTVSCDVGGNGNQSLIIFDDPSCMIDKDSVEIEWEVVSISGTAVRIG